jgi:hypothetical protein
MRLLMLLGELWMNKRMGYEEEADRIQQLFFDGKREEAALE